MTFVRGSNGKINIPRLTATFEMAHSFVKSSLLRPCCPPRTIIMYHRIWSKNIYSQKYLAAEYRIIGTYPAIISEGWNSTYLRSKFTP